MPMKGAILPDHIAKNRFKLLAIGLPPLTVTVLGGLEEELKTVDLPDNTKASGGDTNPVEFTFSVPMHHFIEIAALEAWFVECQICTPSYKKSGTLTFESISGSSSRNYMLDGLFLTKRALPDGDMSDDGEMQAVEWTASVDKILPLT